MCKQTSFLARVQDEILLSISLDLMSFLHTANLIIDHFMPANGPMIVRISPPRWIERKAKDDVEINFFTLSPPDEIEKAFGRFPVLIRWSPYLVLAESKTELGKHERLACLNVWGPQVDVMAQLFAHSVKGDITII